MSKGKRSELAQRVLTGFLFGLVLIGGILSGIAGLTVLMAFVWVGGLMEYQRLAKACGQAPKPLFTFAFGALSAAAGMWPAFGGLSPAWLSLWPLGFLLLASASAFTEMFFQRPNHLQNLGAELFGGLYFGAAPGLLIALSGGLQGDYNALKVLFFFLFMWASDTGAYFSGKYFGKTKLFERLSPKKTVEGLVGGTLLASLTGVFAWQHVGGASLPEWIGAGAFLALSGTAGDLFESMLKRQAGVKDSGNLLPGHGGILDRFDSTYFSALFYALFLHFSS